MLRISRACALCLCIAAAGAVLAVAAGPERRIPPRSSPPPPTLVGVGRPDAPDALSWTPDGRSLFAVAAVRSAGAGLFRIRTGRRPRRVGGLGRFATAAVSPDASRIAAYEEGEFGARIEFRALDGRLVSRSASFASNPYEYPRLIWSPDSRRLVVTTPARRKDLRVLDAATGRVVGAFDGPPTYLDRQLWSPDGRRLAIPTRDGVSLVDVVTSHRRLIRGASSYATYAWSRDGRRLATTGPGGGVFVVDIASHRRCRVTRHSAFGTSWSPDGRLAFMLVQDEDAPAIVVGVVQPCSGSDRSPVALVKVADDDGLGDILTWSPDGRRLALSLDGQV